VPPVAGFQTGDGAQLTIILIFYNKNILEFFFFEYFTYKY